MTTADRIRTLLAKDYKIDPEKLTAEAPLDELGIDSIGVAELMFNIESEFKLTLPQEQMSLRTFGDVTGYIDGLLESRDTADAAKQAQPADPYAVS